MLFTLLLSLLFSADVLAKRTCRPTWNSDHTFFGGTCETMSIRNSAGRTVAALGEIMRMNPAVLPTVLTPLGAEFNVHNEGFGPQKSRTEFHVIKGLPWVGLGGGSWNTGSMVGSDLPALFAGSSQQANFEQYERTLPSRNGYRLGASVQLPLIPQSPSFRLRVGLTTGSGKVNGESGNGYGAVIDVNPFFFSYSNMSEKFSSSRSSISVDTSTYSIGIDSAPFHAGYAYAMVHAARRMPGASTITLRYSGALWSLFGSWKLYENYAGERQSWPSATIHHNFGDYLTAGYLYGLYRNSHSLSLQVFL